MQWPGFLLSYLPIYQCLLTPYCTQNNVITHIIWQRKKWVGEGWKRTPWPFWSPWSFWGEFIISVLLWYFIRRCFLDMPFKMNNQQLFITLHSIRTHHSSLFLTFQLDGLCLYHYWTGKSEHPLVWVPSQRRKFPSFIYMCINFFIYLSTY